MCSVYENGKPSSMTTLEPFSRKFFIELTPYGNRKERISFYFLNISLLSDLILFTSNVHKPNKLYLIFIYLIITVIYFIYQLLIYMLFILCIYNYLNLHMCEILYQLLYTTKFQVLKPSNN